ncbi:MAG: F0F1 ATP synthase subunit alpha, partial [Muribaculaceae bacterium]|nr:F0F1 ATP synthase subunit alpha [Muribaculaceae bacterium]
YHPWPVENEIAVIYCGVNGLLENVPLESVHDFEEQFLQQLKLSYPGALDELRKGNLTEDVQQQLTKVATEVANRIASAAKK